MNINNKHWWNNNDGRQISIQRTTYTCAQARIYARAPKAANFQGRHIKKIEIEVRYAEKKGCPRERNLREIYTENNVGTEFSRYDATGARMS